MKLLQLSRNPQRIARAIPPGHCEVFMERYETLLRWAYGFARERGTAEDLVHEAFVQFLVASPELSEIQNLDNYLCTMLRNINISNLRRRTSDSRPRAIAEFDSAELMLLSLDPRAEIEAHLHAQQELLRVCQYVCGRKQTSKSASVLILRFFHGYYPGEIARILRRTRKLVDEQLRIARQDVQTHAANVWAASAAAIPPGGRERRNPSRLLGELKNEIFQSCVGRCLSPERLREYYTENDDCEWPDTGFLAHLVSCPVCLDHVNGILGLTPLSDRDPHDTIGPAQPGGSGEQNPSRGNGKNDIVQNCLKRAKRILEHRPEGLAISVNGYEVFSQNVTANLDENLSVNLAEPVGFVEVFSSEGVRLLMLNVEAPPQGSLKQSGQTVLSGNRLLRIGVEFTAQWPKLHIVYHDPELAAAPIPAIALRSVAPPESILPDRVGRGTIWDLLLGWAPRLKLAATAVLAIVVFGGLFWLLRREQSPAAAHTLLAQSMAGEKQNAKPGFVAHRKFDFSVVDAESRQTLSQYRIETWVNPGKRTKAQRVYATSGKLVAAEWTRPDGKREIYPVEKNLGTTPPESALDPKTVWTLTPSASEFRELIPAEETLSVEERVDYYRLSYSDGHESGSGPRLVSASLTLRRADVHPVEQVLKIRYGTTTREYRFVETDFETQQSSSVDDSVFQPDPESQVRSERRVEALNPAVHLVPATVELQIDTLARLDAANALLGEQLTFGRTPQGQFSVSAVVQSDARKDELLHALGPLTRNPAVRLDIRSIAAAAVELPDSQPRRRVLSVEGVEVGSTIPLEEDLRKYFSKDDSISERRLQEEVAQFANGLSETALELRLHAMAIKQVSEQFSVSDWKTMPLPAKAKLRTLLNRHAGACLGSLNQLRRDLGPLEVPAERNSSETMLVTETDLAYAAARLFELASATNEAVWVSASSSTSIPRTVPVKTAKFWKDLAKLESLAQGISMATATHGR